MATNEHRLNQLQSLLKIKQAEKQAALRQLATVKQQFQQAKDQLDKMMQYREEYQSQIASLGETGCSINRVKQRILFIEQLDIGIKQLNQQLALIGKQRRQCELTLIDKQKKVQAVEKLIEARQNEANQAANRLEKKEIDEYATKQWYNNGNY